jgi:hypothetical protein
MKIHELIEALQKLVVEHPEAMNAIVTVEHAHTEFDSYNEGESIVYGERNLEKIAFSVDATNAARVYLGFNGE